MDIGSDHETLLAAMAHDGAPDGRPRPDWRGLRARLSAGYAMRRTLIRTGGAGSESRCGSFDSTSARLIATYEEGLAAINRTVLSNGKSSGGISAAIAGTDIAGG